jgi:hypothetical protein
VFCLFTSNEYPYSDPDGGRQRHKHCAELCDVVTGLIFRKSGNTNWNVTNGESLGNSYYYYYYYYYYFFLVITFMQRIYSYIPVTNQVYRVYSVAAVLYWQFVLHVMLLRKWNTRMFCTFALAFSVQCPIWLLSAVTWFLALPVCCLGIAWVILRWFIIIIYVFLLFG